MKIYIRWELRSGIHPPPPTTIHPPPPTEKFNPLIPRSASPLDSSECRRILFHVL